MRGQNLLLKTHTTSGTISIAGKKRGAHLIEKLAHIPHFYRWKLINEKAWTDAWYGNLNLMNNASCLSHQLCYNKAEEPGTCVVERMAGCTPNQPRVVWASLGTVWLTPSLRGKLWTLTSVREWTGANRSALSFMPMNPAPVDLQRNALARFTHSW